MALEPLYGRCSAGEAAMHRAVTAAVLPHPLEERDLRIAACPAGATLAELVALEWPFPAEHPVVAVDGRIVPRDAWPRTVLAPGSRVVLRAMVRGGGGGGGKNPLRTVLQIGLLVASIYFPPLLGFNTFWTAVATAALVVGGTLIINALVPPAEPEAAAQPLSGSNPATEPAYSLTGGGNQARAYQPMMLVLGEHRVFPDLSAPEYSILNGPVQTVWQVYHFGVGDLDISEEKLGTNDIDALPGIETERSGQDGAIALAHGAVHTQAGPGDLIDTTHHSLTVPDDTVEVHISLVGRIFRIDDKGKRQNRSVSVRITAPGGGTQTVSLSSDGRSPVRRTLRYPVSGADRTVSVQRVSAPSTNERVYDEVSWSALGAVRRDAGNYAGQTRYAVRAESSSQVSGRLQRFSALVRQKVPVWRGGAWSAPEATSNPAWLFRWYALGYRYQGQLIAGIGLAAGRIDEEAIRDWGAWCEAEQLRCDFVLSRTASHDEVLRIIARCGRAAHTWQSGRLGVVWDQGGRPTGAMVTPGNVVAGSVSARYAGGQAAEEIAVRFVDPDADWQWSTLRRTVPGVEGFPTSTATVTLEGVTTRRQAAIECNLQAARQVHHRRRISWGMSAEGLDLMIGDVVALTHSLIDGGVAGRLAGGTGERVILDRELALDGSADSRMMFRPLSGDPHVTAVSAGDDPREVVLAEPLAESPSAEDTVPHDILWRYYDADAPPARVRVVGVKPLSDSQVVIEAIDEVDAYYDAATSDLSAPIAAATLRPPEVLRIDITESLVRVGSGLAVEIDATIAVSGDWRGGIVTARLDGGEERTVARLLEGETSARWLEEPEGALLVAVTPGTAAVAFGETFTRAYDIVGITAPPAVPVNFLVDVLGDGTRRFRWVPPGDFDLAGLSIRYARGDLGTATLWDDQTPLHRGILTASPWETVEPGPGRWLFTARAVDTGGRLSSADVRILATLGAQRLGDAVIWRCPGAEGWPGTIEGAIRSADGLDALEGAGAYGFDDTSTWDALADWSLGDGDDGATSLTYTPPAEDLGAILTVALRWSADTAGNVVFEARVAETEAALTSAAWAPYVAGTTLTGRWLQVRWRFTGDGTVLLRMDHLCWSAHAPIGSRQVLDADTSGWSGSAATGRVVPVAGFLTVTDLVVTLQNVGAGWTWELVSKAPPTIRIYDADRNPVDATVDVTVRGVLA